MSRFSKWAPWMCVFIGLLSSPALPAQQAPAQSVKVLDGTIVRLALLESLNSGKSEVNDTVHFEAVEEVKVGDVIVVPRGSAGVGHVVDVEKKKRMGRAGKLNFAVDYVKGFDGSNIRLRASSSAKGKDKSGTVVATTLLVSPLFLLMHGKDVNVAKGTQFNAYVDGDREIALGGPAPAPGPAQPSAPAPTSAPPQPSAQAPAPAPVASEDLATVVIKSTPDGAEISVNGKYVGSTPSTVRLPPGDQAISIEKSGFKSWQRTMSVSPGGIVTIDARLEQQ